MKAFLGNALPFKGSKLISVLSSQRSMPPKNKDYARLTITVPNPLKETLEQLAEFPYKSVSNAALVLMTEALNHRASQPKRAKDEIIEALIELEDSADLVEIGLRVLEKLHLKGFSSSHLGDWALAQISQQSEIPLERLGKIVAGARMTAKELEKLARVLQTTPPEVKRLLQGETDSNANA
jgi:hypothetical protein